MCLNPGHLRKNFKESGKIIPTFFGFLEKKYYLCSRKQTQKNMNVLDLIKKDLQKKKDMFGRPMIDTIVILKKDDKGYYIEYAFKEGAPHDNRCLSWYDSYQPEAYIRNGWFTSNDGVDLPEDETQKRLNQIRQAREEKIGKVFRLSSFTCGHEENPEESNRHNKESWEKYHPNEEYIPENHVCRPGCPSKNCLLNGICSKYWTYENPVKCACWYLRDGKTMEDYIKDYKISIPATELAELL